MEQETKKRSVKKKVAATVAVVMAIAITLGGTYMYQEYTMHSTNEMTNDDVKYDATLIENFIEDKDWEVADGPVTKQVSVKNTGLTDGSYAEVYVRIQLKEYFEIQPMHTEKTDVRYMVDNAGRFIVYDSDTAALADYPNRDVKYLTDAVSGITGWFVPTQGDDKNGQYGKYVYTVYQPSTTIDHVIGETRYDSDAHTKHNEEANGECTYPIHFWENTDLDDVRAQDYMDASVNTKQIKGSDYIKWILGGEVAGEPTVILYSDWVDEDQYDSQPIAAWIIDDRAKTEFNTGEDDGPWIYWGQLLQPGEETEDFLKAIQLLKQPDGTFYYAIHVEMQAVSLDELLRADDDPLLQWADMPDEIKDSYVENSPKVIIYEGSYTAGSDSNKVADPEYTIKLKAGENTVDFSADVKPTNLTDKTVTWDSSDPSVATVDENTGLVTGKATGKTIITATSVANGKKASVTVNVEDVITGFKVDWQSYINNYYDVANVTDPSGLPTVVNFDHGSTTEATDSRTWRATVSGDEANPNSNWTIVSQTGTDAKWHTAVPATTNYLEIPADYTGTITVKVAAVDNEAWDVVFDIEVEPRPTIAEGRQISEIDSGDSGSSGWTEVATYKDKDNNEYSLIVRNHEIGTRPSFGSNNDYKGSNVQNVINAWWNGITTGKLVDNAVTHNALDRLGTTCTNVGDGFSKPLGDTPQSGAIDIAFPMSSGEAIQFCSTVGNSQSGTSINSVAQAYTNWNYWVDKAAWTWLRSPGNDDLQASMIYSGGTVSSRPLETSGIGVRPALWVKSEIFD
ncbi:MAG: Ig-like domain-containing protein [Tannerella sp.]|jgi:hypothetical protein|nr:Ig-like domain-containing protein [Tannerella sp.]